MTLSCWYEFIIIHESKDQSWEPRDLGTLSMFKYQKPKNIPNFTGSYYPQRCKWTYIQPPKLQPQKLKGFDNESFFLLSRQFRQRKWISFADTKLILFHCCRVSTISNFVFSTLIRPYVVSGMKDIIRLHWVVQSAAIKGNIL